MKTALTIALLIQLVSGLVWTLAVAGTPMVVAYRVDRFAARLRFLVQVPSIVLANLILDEAAFPEFIQEHCAPEPLANALAPLFDSDSPERAAQASALARAMSFGIRQITSSDARLAAMT